MEISAKKSPGLGKLNSTQTKKGPYSNTKKREKTKKSNKRTTNGTTQLTYIEPVIGENKEIEQSVRNYDPQTKPADAFEDDLAFLLFGSPIQDPIATSAAIKSKDFDNKAEKLPASTRSKKSSRITKAIKSEILDLDIELSDDENNNDKNIKAELEGALRGGLEEDLGEDLGVELEEEELEEDLEDKKAEALIRSVNPLSVESLLSLEEEDQDDDSDFDEDRFFRATKRHNVHEQETEECRKSHSKIANVKDITTELQMLKVNEIKHSKKKGNERMQKVWQGTKSKEAVPRKVNAYYKSAISEISAQNARKEIIMNNYLKESNYKTFEKRKQNKPSSKTTAQTKEELIQGSKEQKPKIKSFNQRGA